MIKKTLFIIISTVLIIAASNYSLLAQNNIILPGKYDDYTLLPNGWKISPLGVSISVGGLPLNMIITKDENYALTSNSGMGENSISVVNLKTNSEVQRISVDKTWRGLAFNKDESQLFVSGANNNMVYIYNFYNGELSLQDSVILGKKFPAEKISVTGLSYVKTRNYLLVVSKESNSLYIIDMKNKKVIKSIKLDGKCFDVITNHAETEAYVSVWGKASIAVINLQSLKLSSTINVGDHPCEMIITKDDSRLFVSNANNNTTSSVDLKLKKETEKLNSAVSVEAPFGSTPDAVCFNKDESILFVANADNNYIALFDISEKNNSKSMGFIPAGWYPTSVKYLNRSNKIIVVSGKGLSSMPNLKGPNPLVKGSSMPSQYTGTMFKGAISIFNFPSSKELSKYTQRVYLNTPYMSKEKDWMNIQNVIPVEHNMKPSTKIKHVFYIIKENRTYDQVYGDLKQGNGDSSLCIFGNKLTPNQHKLVESYSLFDNFYADAEVSADGHNWSTAAYATDYVEKNWPVLYGRRGGSYDFEGGEPAAAPSSGYIWNNVLNHSLTFRNYGEFVGMTKNDSGYYEPRDADLKEYTCKTFPPFNMDISDITRYEEWKKEFEQYEKNGLLPNLTLLRLPNNHTEGTRKGKLTPQAYVAQNDYALGLIVDKISKSKFWKESIIFVVEDDAQNGPDHVDAHRSCLMVIGPYVKRNFVDHTMYSTSSVLKTIELILGLPPMTQFDLSATPILFAITDNPSFDTYNVIKPLINIDERNTASAYGAERSGQMNFAREDAIPDIELNEIIWKSIKGKNSLMPAPVRSAFVKNINEHDDD